jgi:hypothetical protein
VRTDIPIGSMRWFTVAPPSQPDGVVRFAQPLAA